MRVRVELRRNAGRFIARFRKTEGFTGDLMTSRKEVWDRQIPYLTISLEPRQGYPNERLPGPELFEARVTEVTGEAIRFMGWEITKDLCWCVQEWDCEILPPRRNQAAD